VSIRPNVPSKNLTEMNRAQITDLFAELGEPGYRVQQVYRWVFQRGARSLDDMSDLPKALRARLAEAGYAVGRATVDRVAVSVDETRKLAIRLDDGSVVETVLIPMGEGKFTQCISSQVGCALDCKFCFTATLGLHRHLTPGEIIDQVIIAREHLPPDGRVTNLVYMGMGEPLHNLDGVLGSLGPITAEDGLGFSHRRVTVSTSGLVPQIAKLGEVAPVNLALSLNATTDAVRDAIMPINKRYPIASLMAALRAYPLPPRRKLTVEYVLLGGVNDTDADAHRLAELVRRLPVRINLIPWNPFQGPGYERPDEARVKAFHQILDRRGLTVTVRGTKGLDIDAACGQLGERPDASPDL
jgi:23S rRNA (adenine2503-C2)-methyltransferase